MNNIIFYSLQHDAILYKFGAPTSMLNNTTISEPKSPYPQHILSFYFINFYVTKYHIAL